jgi:hypothetical protein
MDRRIRTVSLAALLALAALSAAAATARAGALPFIEDDYARALAQARQQNLPLFVEVWAPW